MSGERAEQAKHWLDVALTDLACGRMRAARNAAEYAVLLLDHQQAEQLLIRGRLTGRTPRSERGNTGSKPGP